MDEIRHFCPDCGKSYKFKQGLYEHRKFKCGKNPSFQCPFCPKRCYVKGHLRQHILSCKFNSSNQTKKLFYFKI